MRKTRKTAVMAAVLLGTVGFLGAGTAYAHDHGHGHGHKHHGREVKTLVVNQSTTCSTTDENTDVQGQTASVTNWPHGEVSSSPQTTNVGSHLGCDNTLVFGK
ncbi:hypothetical protein [Streptomyces sp. NPDC001401]|uniref:hypothetical protein n=1 Tax=Streptomyces sp. NPDC001401 TaxID=3364570 RepID=UPI003673C994